MKNPPSTRSRVRLSIIADAVLSSAREAEAAKAKRDAAIAAAVKAGLSLREVADLAGVSHGTVSTIAKKAEDEG